MKNNSKKKLAIFVKVFLMHLLILLLIDINFLKILGFSGKNIEIKDSAKFVNLKSISLEEIEKIEKKLGKKRRDWKI